MKELLAVIGVALGFLGYAPYIRDTIRGVTRPHVYTWFSWALLSAIIFALQVSDNAGAGAYITLSAAVICFIIFLLALRQGNKDITITDTLVMVVALIGLCLWLIAKQPTVSILLLVGVDVLAFFPTVRKSWNKPQQETLISYVIACIRQSLGIITLQKFTLVTALFPVTWTIANVLFVAMLVIRRKILMGKHN